ncbi:hypothetical protein IE53DRAFT_190505 [Violaceomyces palustris]|uniref:Uncharacterized protein n=1 Tax=Violaceomyces palustris TaxID=1673888 RepID=A0ACD0P5N3_9BASI|nr:hypothetical protein IE53DRAFT_190505 [Violaceomyces palustris]
MAAAHITPSASAASQPSLRPGADPTRPHCDLYLHPTFRNSTTALQIASLRCAAEVARFEWRQSRGRNRERCSSPVTDPTIRGSRSRRGSLRRSSSTELGQVSGSGSNGAADELPIDFNIRPLAPEVQATGPIQPRREIIRHSSDEELRSWDKLVTDLGNYVSEGTGWPPVRVQNYVGSVQEWLKDELSRRARSSPNDDRTLADRTIAMMEAELHVARLALNSRARLLSRSSQAAAQNTPRHTSLRSRTTRDAIAYLERLRAQDGLLSAPSPSSPSRITLSARTNPSSEQTRSNDTMHDPDGSDSDALESGSTFESGPYLNPDPDGDRWNGLLQGDDAARRRLRLRNRSALVISDAAVSDEVASWTLVNASINREGDDGAGAESELLTQSIDLASRGSALEGERRQILTMSIAGENLDSIPSSRADQNGRSPRIANTAAAEEVQDPHLQRSGSSPADQASVTVSQEPHHPESSHAVSHSNQSRGGVSTADDYTLSDGRLTQAQTEYGDDHAHYSAWRVCR